MRIVLTGLLYCVICVVVASPAVSVEDRIDQSVWIPFKQAFESQNGEALNRLYADQVLRVTPQGIDTRNEFKSSNLRRFEANRKRGDTIQLNFWLDRRQTTDSVSYNVGFYRIGIKAKDGVTNYHYGQFHIVLRKVNDRWLIVQDWDTDSIAGEEISAEHFDKQPVQF